MTNENTASRNQWLVALLAIVAIVVHLLLRFAIVTDASMYETPLIMALMLGGIPLVWGFAGQVVSSGVWLRSVGRHLDCYCGVAW